VSARDEQIEVVGHVGAADEAHLTFAGDDGAETGEEGDARAIAGAHSHEPGLAGAQMTPPRGLPFPGREDGIDDAGLLACSNRFQSDFRSSKPAAVKKCSNCISQL